MAAEMNDLSNAGPVRPLNGLAYEPDWIDCPFCRRRVKTQVTSVASEQTKQTQVNYCIGGFWALGLCYFVPEWQKMYHNKEHHCPLCGERVAVVRHDQPVINVNYVPSAFAAKLQPPPQKDMAYKGPAISSI